METILKEDGELLIGLTLEEYQELIMIKGKYEELKEKQPYFYPTIINPPIHYYDGKITSTETEEPKYPYKITCSK